MIGMLSGRVVHSAPASTAPSVIDELIEQMTAPLVANIISVYLRAAPEQIETLKQGVEQGDLKFPKSSPCQTR